MAAIITTPIYTDNNFITGMGSKSALQSLSRGSVLRKTLDLTTVFGAYVWGQVGKGGTTVITSGSGVLFIARRLLDGNDGTASNIPAHPIGPLGIGQSGAAAQSIAMSASGNAIGALTLTTNANITLSAGDLCFIDGTGGTGNSEIVRATAAVAATTSITIDAPTQYAHNNTSDHIRNLTDLFGPFWLAGGSVYEIIYDYGAAAAGDTVQVRTMYQLYEEDSSQ